MDKIDSVIGKFFKRNSISEEVQGSERYLVDFRDKLSNFLQNNGIQENQNVKEFIIDSLENYYCYYSKVGFEQFYKETYDFVKKHYTDRCLDIASCKFTAISNKNPYTHNSSEHMITLFMDLHDIDNYYRDRNIKEMLALEYDFYRISSKKREIVGKIEENKKELDSSEDAQQIKRLEDIIRKREDKLSEQHEECEKIKRKINTKQKSLEDKFRQTKILVLLDDFSGSGETIIDYLDVLEKYLPKDIEVIIACLHVMSKAEERLEEWKTSHPSMNLFFYFPNKEDKFFENTKVKQSKDQNELQRLQSELKYFEEKYVCGEDEKKHILGYADTQALVTNYRNTPNNTFSMFWKRKESTTWSPLFPRKEKQGISIYNRFDTQDRQLIRANIFKKCTNKRIKDLKLDTHRGVGMMIFLVYVHQNDGKYFENEDNTLVFDLIKDYNSNALQDCLDNKFIIGKAGFFEISDIGFEKLKDVGLFEYSLEELAKNTVFGAQDSLKSDQRYYPKIST